MNNRSNALTISALIITILEEAKKSIDEETQLAIKKTLTNIDEESPEIQRNSIREVVEKLSKYPIVRSRLISKLQSLATNYPETEAYQIRSFIRQIPYEEPSGLLYVCPVDPEHYRRRLDAPLEHPYCPLHGVMLVIFE